MEFTGEIRALTLREPFATLMLHGKIETRTWSTKYRGMVLLTCGEKSYTDEQLLDICGAEQYSRLRKWIDNNGGPDALKYFRGKAYALGRLVGVRPMDFMENDEENCWVEYRYERYCFDFLNVKQIVPFKYRGHLSLLPISDEVKSQIHLQQFELSL